MEPKIGYVSMFKVRFNECDPMGHLNNANYLTYLEQVAFDAAAAPGFDRFSLVENYGSLFVVRKHEITYHQPALENEWLMIRAWGSNLRAARAWRTYSVSKFTGDPASVVTGQVNISDLPEVAKRDIVVSAETEFAFMNVTTGRPVRIPQEFIEAFFVEDEGKTKRSSNVVTVGSGFIPEQQRSIRQAGNLNKRRNDRTNLTSRHRLRGMDYTDAGFYVLTIATHDRQQLFGKVQEDQLVLSGAGRMMGGILTAVPTGFPGIEIDSWAVLPDHFHLLIYQSISNVTISTSDVVRWVKGVAVAQYARGVKEESWPRYEGKLWQTSSHDRIVRNDNHLDEVR